MDLLKKINEIFASNNEFVKCKNFYFENHLCSTTNETKKIMLDYAITENNSETKIIFGQCSDCKKVFYNIDYD